MVLLTDRHTNKILEVSINEANILIRQQKAYLLKPSNMVSILTSKGISEIEYNLAVTQEKKGNCQIIEWITKEEISKLEKVNKKNKEQKENIN